MGKAEREPAVIQELVNITKNLGMIDSEIVLSAADELSRVRTHGNELIFCMDDLLMAIDLPGNHCELAPAVKRARAALSKAKGEG